MPPALGAARELDAGGRAERCQNRLGIGAGVEGVDGAAAAVGILGAGMTDAERAAIRQGGAG